MKCTVSGNECSEQDGATTCSCVACSAWRVRHAVGLRSVGATSKLAEHVAIKNLLSCTNAEVSEILDGGMR